MEQAIFGLVGVVVGGLVSGGATYLMARRGERRRERAAVRLVEAELRHAANVVSCTPTSGSTFAIGDTTVDCTATDAGVAGFFRNSASASFAVHVKGAAEQISDLAANIRALNLKQGIANSLDAKLQNLLAALADVKGGARVSACNKLDAVVNEINAQAGKAITEAQAATRLADLARIWTVLAC